MGNRDLSKCPRSPRSPRLWDMFVAGILPAVISCEDILSIAHGVPCYVEGMIRAERNNAAERRSARPRSTVVRQHRFTLHASSRHSSRADAATLD